jgi:hypothetical protein
MLGHLQKFVKHGFMLAVELEACRVAKDPALPASMEGYVVSFTAFHERGFSVPLHLFLLLAPAVLRPRASPPNSL